MISAYRRPFVLGAGAVAVYVVVAVVTIRSSDDRVRPLFEGVGPNAPYQWVNPPKAFAAGNVKPHPNDSQVALGPEGNLLAGAGSTDRQIILNLPQGAIPPHPPDDHVTIRSIPTDPATLGKTPPGTRPNGNAYKLEATYQPSRTPIPRLTAPGNAILIVPEPAQGLLFSPDGASWRQLQSQDIGGVGTVAGPFDQAGYYLAAASPFTAQADESGDSSSVASVIVVGTLTAALALLLIFGPGIARRIKRRRQKAEPSVVRAARTQRARAKKRKKR